MTNPLNLLSFVQLVCSWYCHERQTTNLLHLRVAPSKWFYISSASHSIRNCPFRTFTHLLSTASLYTTFLNLPGASLAICNHCISDIFIATGCLAIEKENKRRKLTLFLASARSLTIRSQLSPTPRPYLQRLRQLSQNRYHRPLPLVPRLKKSHSSTERRNSSATSRQ